MKEQSLMVAGVPITKEVKAAMTRAALNAEDRIGRKMTAYEMDELISFVTFPKRTLRQ